MKVKFEPGPAAGCWLAVRPMCNAPVSGPGPLLLRPLACLNIAVGLGSLLSLVSTTLQTPGVPSALLVSKKVMVEAPPLQLDWWGTNYMVTPLSSQLSRVCRQGHCSTAVTLQHCPPPHHRLPLVVVPGTIDNGPVPQRRPLASVCKRVKTCGVPRGFTDHCAKLFI